MSPPPLVLKKGEDKRLREGHLWIYSNEIDSKLCPLKNYQAGQEVLVLAANKDPLGVAYVNPHSLIMARLISRDPKASLNAAWLKERLSTALQGREALYPQPYYRLAFGESDALPGLVIDRFGDHLVVQCNTAGMDKAKELLLPVLRELIPTCLSLLFRNDSSIRRQEGLEEEVRAGFGEPPEEVLIEENGVRFSVPLWKGQKTGWFYDHRLNRSRLKDYVKDKSVLDVFAYLGAWGIQAAAFGAKSVCCLDSSAFATNRILKNAALNGVEEKVSIRCEDAFEGLQALYREGQRFEVVTLDPPAFIKKRKDLKEGLLAYQRINALALKLLKPQGILVSGSCSMHLSREDFHRCLEKAALSVKVPVQLLEQGHQSPDHPIALAIPETEYLKMSILRRMD